MMNVNNFGNVSESINATHLNADDMWNKPYTKSGYSAVFNTEPTTVDKLDVLIRLMGVELLTASLYTEIQTKISQLVKQL